MNRRLLASTANHRQTHLLIASAVAVGGMTLFALRKNPPESLIEIAAIAMLPVLLVALARRSARDVMLWVGYITALVVFAKLRAGADDLMPWRFEYVIALDRLVGLGHLPTAWLQERLYTLGSPTRLDWAMVWVHVSYFGAPHLVGFIVWGYYRGWLPQYLTAMVATYYAALAVQALIPTAPPWLAALNGHEHVHRIMWDLALETTPETYERVHTIIGRNDVAAMPSLHTAATVVTALMLAALSRLGAWIGWTYVAVMAFCLVYMGEHYVVDALAGAALAVLIWRATGRLLSPAGAFEGLDDQGSEPKPCQIPAAARR